MKFFFLISSLLIGTSLIACSPQKNTASYTSSAKNLSGLNSPTEFRIAMGSRWMVAGALEDIFGKNTVVPGGSTVGSLTQSFVLNQISSWGGPCDPYADSLPVPHAQNGGINMTIETPSVRGCSAPVYSQASVLPGSSTSRLAWTIRSCDKILASDAALLFAATQIGVSSSELSRPPSNDQIKAAFNLFHRGVDMDSGVGAALQSVVAEASKQFPNSSEPWRFLFLTLCQSPGWQIL